MDWSVAFNRVITGFALGITAILVANRPAVEAAVAEAKQITMKTRIEEGLPTILADSDKLEQVLWNLIGNAIKFTREHGTVTMDCRRASDDGVLFTVSGTRCGIAPDDIPKVFDQFSGVHSQIPSAKGAQLGLYITKSLVLLHGGRIWVESIPGEGSQFYVHQPMRRPDTKQTESGS